MNKGADILESHPGGKRDSPQPAHSDLLAATGQEGKKEVPRPEGRGNPKDAGEVGASQNQKGAGVGLQWAVQEEEGVAAQAVEGADLVLGQAA